MINLYKALYKRNWLLAACAVGLTILAFIVAKRATAPDRLTVFVARPVPWTNSFMTNIVAFAGERGAYVTQFLAEPFELQKMVSSDDLRAIRRRLASRSLTPKALEIHNASEVVAIVPKGDDRSMRVRLVKKNGQWEVGSEGEMLEDKISPGLWGRLLSLVKSLTKKEVKQ